MIKEFGCYQKNMSSILNDLGLDKEDFQWWHLAVCDGMDTNLFYDKYEADHNIAKSIDEACLSCPVINVCYREGKNNNEYGVWGGVYLNSGSVDRARNSHKTPDTWKRLKKHNVS